MTLPHNLEAEMGVKLFYGDCLKELKNIPDNAAKLCLTSPPYNMNLRIRNGKYCSRQIVKEISTKYQNYDDNLTMEKYFSFNKSVIMECLRVSPIVFYNVQFLTGNKVALFKIIGEFAELLKEIIVWDKVNAQPAISGGVLNSQYEAILVFDKFNAISRKFNSAEFDRGTLSNCWKIKRGKKLYKTHGATFPVELAQKVVGNFTKRGETVIDPLMGTGTTGIVCQNLGRKFIGIENDKEYFEIAKHRMLENRNDLTTQS